MFVNEDGSNAGIKDKGGKALGVKEAGFRGQRSAGGGPGAEEFWPEFCIMAEAGVKKALKAGLLPMDFFERPKAGEGFGRGAREFWDAYEDLKSGFGQMEPGRADERLRGLAGDFARAFAGAAEASDLEKAKRFAQGAEYKAQMPGPNAKGEVSAGGGLSLVEIVLSMGLMGSVLSGVFMAYPSASEAARAQNMASEFGMAQSGVKNAYAARGSYEGISAKLLEKMGAIRPGSALAAMPAAGGKSFALAMPNDFGRPCSALAGLAGDSQVEWRLSAQAALDGASADALSLSEPVDPKSVPACEARFAREPAQAVVAVYK